MAGSSFFNSMAKVGSVTGLMVSALFLAACGNGDGPESIAGTPAPTLPPPPPGFCDAINFEVGCPEAAIINFNGGATVVIDNPDKSGINDSNRVARMEKYPDEVFGGTRLDVPNPPIDFALGEFYKVKVWSSRPVPVTFKLEEEGNPGGGLATVEDHTGGSEWQELCFDFTGQAVPPPVLGLTIIFDNGELGQADTDPGNWTFYYDDIEQVSSCVGGGDASITPDVALFATEGDPDLIIPDDYAELTPFGSGSVIDPDYADDGSYSPALSVFSGADYGANIAQAGFIGFRPGFLGAYETLDFKVKGMPNFVIFVKLFDGVDALRINLTSSSFSTELADGWFQVSIPVSRFADVGNGTGIVFESDDTSATQFRMLLTDIGFSGVGDNPPEVADPGIIPEVGAYVSDVETMNEDLAPPGGIQNFGSGAVFADVFDDWDFNRALQVTSGEGYGEGVHVGFAAFTGYAAGFASSYETFQFKVKADAANLGSFEVKFIGNGDTSQEYDLTTYDGVTDLGAGWLQVSIPVSDFAATVAGNDGFLLGPLGGQDAAFSFLMTDIGFSGTVSVDPGTIPEVVIYATDPNETVDLVFGVDYTGFEAFGSGSAFDNNVVTDQFFNPAFGVTTGAGYGAQVGQFAIVGFTAGFATGYETLDFKAKGLNNDLIRVKFLDAGDYVDVVLSGSAFSTDLGSGWYQVSIPLTSFTGVDTATGLLFETDNTAPEAFTFLLTDFGFSGTVGGPATSPDSIIPSTVIFATDPNETVDLVFGVDYTEITGFGSGAVFDGFYADDPDFNPAFAVTSGAGYGANVAQLAYIGFAPGFASAYTTLEFKVKGMPDDLIRVKFLDNGDYLDVTLTDPTYSTPLGNDWYQVSIPLSAFTGVDTATGLLFESNNTSPTQFTFLLTDIGFSTSAGIVPEVVIYATDPNETVDLVFGVDYAGFEAFGSGSAFDNNVMTDQLFNPAFGVTTGDGYGAQVGQFAIVGFAGGFATGYETLHFKAKGLSNDLIRVKFLDAGEYVDINLATSGYATALGNGWYQVSVPMVDFAGVDTATALLFETDNTAPAAFTFLLTDIGFDVGGGGGPGPGGDTVLVTFDEAVPPAVTEFGGAGYAIEPGPAGGDGNALKIARDGGEVFAGAWVAIPSIPNDAGVQTLSALVYSPTAGVPIVTKVEFADNQGTGDVQANEAVVVGWQTLTWTYINLAAPNDYNRFTILPNLGVVDTATDYYFDNITLLDAGDGGGGEGGELAANGDFETGDLTGWTTFDNGGTIEVVADNGPSSAGTFAGHINVTIPGNPTLKQANVGVGEVTPGQTVTVSFDWKGTDAAGGVVDVVLFSELAGGGVSQADAILAGAGFPADWTPVGPLDITVGPDVSGGITLQITAICGGVAGCVSDIFIDNVSITIP